MARKVTLIPGDGIGPEIMQAVKEIFDVLQAPVEWEVENAGFTTWKEKGELMPSSLLRSLEKNRIGLKGPITTPVGEGFRSVNIELRQHFDLYANIRPNKSSEAVPTRFENVDLVIIRENTEGLYSGLEYSDQRLGIVDSICRITNKGCERIVRAGFEYARKNGRKRVTLVHKANILKQAGAALLNAGKAIAPEYPGISMDDRIIDNMCMQLVTHPENYDVIVTTNLFGDILSDLAAGLVGGLGVAAGANIGDDLAIFEAVHGSAPDIAGKGLANPTAILKSAVMMLRHMEEDHLANKLDKAIDDTLRIKEQRTADLGGKASTREFSQNIVRNLQRNTEAVELER
ncbi:MAG: isocitrate/isopropylmalate dehydrogenase family protein [Bacteroidota bacterium]|nr:isocitrate/isopropylmalate dehydrogenase family protein [Bacteroidota bacterium]